MTRQDVKIRPAGTYQLYYSIAADRSNPLPLDGASVTGNIYVFASPTASVTSVSFFKGVGTAVYRTDVLAPFDLEGSSGGNALPLDCTALAPDTYAYQAVIQDTIGNAYIVTATFTVPVPVIVTNVFASAQVNTPVVSSSAPAVVATAAGLVGVGSPTISVGGVSSATARSTLGVFRSAQTEASVQTFETRINRAIPANGYVLTFDGSVTSWSGLTTACASTASQFKTRVVSNKSCKLAVTIILYPDKAAAGAFTMAQAASGAYNTDYVAIAQQFKNAGYDSTNLVFRPGWEFNGNYYLWNVTGNQDSTSNPANFVAAFRNFVTSVRSVIPGVKIDWCIKLGGNTTQAVLESCYPGNSYVDIIGCDTYDYYNGYNSNTRNTTGWTAGWNSLRTATNGLDWHRTFATNNSKLTSYPEWGSLHATSTTFPYGGDDNPVFIANMCDWIDQDGAAGRLGYHCYFEADPSDGYHQLHVGKFAYVNATSTFDTRLGGP